MSGREKDPLQDWTCEGQSSIEDYLDEEPASDRPEDADG